MRSSQPSKDRRTGGARYLLKEDRLGESMEAHATRREVCRASALDQFREYGIGPREMPRNLPSGWMRASRHGRAIGLAE